MSIGADRALTVYFANTQFKKILKIQLGGQPLPGYANGKW